MHGSLTSNADEGANQSQHLCNSISSLGVLQDWATDRPITTLTSIGRYLTRVELTGTSGGGSRPSVNRLGDFHADPEN